MKEPITVPVSVNGATVHLRGHRDMNTKELSFVDDLPRWKIVEASGFTVAGARTRVTHHKEDGDVVLELGQHVPANALTPGARFTVTYV